MRKRMEKLNWWQLKPQKSPKELEFGEQWFPPKLILV
jgi:hypothetical protein